jgi:peptide deformylase
MGVGLAAPQIGVSKRMIVIDSKRLGFNQDDKNGINDDYWVLINPVIETGGDQIQWIEGCLSLPMVEGRVKRFSKAKILYMTLDGEQVECDLDWPVSGAIQHECDHLDGLVYILRQSRGNRAYTLKKYWKHKKKSDRELKRLTNVQG